MAFHKQLEGTCQRPGTLQLRHAANGFPFAFDGVHMVGPFMAAWADRLVVPRTVARQAVDGTDTATR